MRKIIVLAFVLGAALAGLLMLGPDPGPRQRGRAIDLAPPPPRQPAASEERGEGIRQEIPKDGGWRLL